MGIAAKQAEPTPGGSRPGDRLLDAGELLEGLPVAVYVCDREGVIVRYNAAAAALWGREPRLGDPAERYCGSLRMFRLDGAPLPHGECPMADVLRTGEPVRDQEVVIERPDGARRVALVEIRAVRDREGGIAGAVNCFQDVTERRREQAQAREKRWRELLRDLPVAVYTTDAEGRLTFYNEAAAALWGHRPELGKSEWCGSWRLRWPNGAVMPHDRCPMAVALKERRAVRGEQAIAERPDGTWTPFLACPMPLFDDTGALAGAVNMLVDLSEVKRADEAAARLAAIVESSDDAIISKNLQAVIQSWNKGAERVFGYTAEEAIGQPVFMLIPEDRHNEEPAILARIRRGERIEHYDTVRRRKDGELIDVSLTVSPIKDAQGRIIGASKIARDVTERKRHQRQQALLVREMNHRIKNVFALVSSLAMLSARSAATPAEMDEALRRRLGALAAAHQLTLPDLASPSAVSEGTDVADLARAVLAPYAAPSEDAPNGRARLRGPAVRVSGEAASNFALLLHEMATNAAKYGALSRPAGRIVVDWTAEDGDLRLTWREVGGPLIAGPPEREGFGSFVARGAVESQFGGELARDWRPEGLIVRLRIPLDRLAR